MKKNIMSLKEIDTMQRNIRMIESSLGHEVPSYLLHSEDLSKNILSFKEVDTITRNVRLLGNSSSRRTYKDVGFSLIDCWPTFFVIFLFLIYLFF